MTFTDFRTDLLPEISYRNRNKITLDYTWSRRLKQGKPIFIWWLGWFFWVFFFWLVLFPSLWLQINWWNHCNLQVNVLHEIISSEEHCIACLRRKLVLFWQSYEHLEITHWAHITGLLLSLTRNQKNQYCCVYTADFAVCWSCRAPRTGLDWTQKGPDLSIWHNESSILWLTSSPLHNRD